MSTYSTYAARGHQDVTPSDATVFSIPFRAIYVGGAGNVRVVALNGSIANYTATAGTRLDVCGTKIMATGNTASLMVAMF